MRFKYTEDIHRKIIIFFIKLCAFWLMLVSLIFIALTLFELSGGMRWLAPYFDSLLVPLICFVIIFVLGLLLFRAKPYGPTK